MVFSFLKIRRLFSAAAASCKFPREMTDAYFWQLVSDLLTLLLTHMNMQLVNFNSNHRESTRTFIRLSLKYNLGYELS